MPILLIGLSLLVGSTMYSIGGPIPPDIQPTSIAQKNQVLAQQWIMYRRAVNAYAMAHPGQGLGGTNGCWSPADLQLPPGFTPQADWGCTLLNNQFNSATLKFDETIEVHGSLPVGALGLGDTRIGVSDRSAGTTTASAQHATQRVSSVISFSGI